MKIGFIGPVGAKLASSLLRNAWGLNIRDIDPDRAQPSIEPGDESAQRMAELRDVVVACLLSPAVEVFPRRP